MKYALPASLIFHAAIGASGLFAWSIAPSGPTETYIEVPLDIVELANETNIQEVIRPRPEPPPEPEEEDEPPQEGEDEQTDRAEPEPEPAADEEIPAMPDEPEADEPEPEPEKIEEPPTLSSEDSDEALIQDLDPPEDPSKFEPEPLSKNKVKLPAARDLADLKGESDLESEVEPESEPEQKPKPVVRRAQPEVRRAQPQSPKSMRRRPDSDNDEEREVFISEPTVRIPLRPEVTERSLEDSPLRSADDDSSEPADSEKESPKKNQSQLDLERSGEGRFAKSEPTIVDGEDLDTPAYLRKRKRR